jgi:hypothetical protein
MKGDAMETSYPVIDLNAGDPNDGTGTHPSSRYMSQLLAAQQALDAAESSDEEYVDDMCAECFRDGMLESIRTLLAHHIGRLGQR